MSTYVVGDIQGCYKPLRKLLAAAKFKPGPDQLWCVGDLVNRGPDSLSTLRYLQDIDADTRIVLGNHDLHFLAIHHGCAPNRGKDTMDKLLRARDCHELSEWLRNKPIAHFDSLDTDKGIQHFLMVHAGVSPLWSLQQTLDCAAEVEVKLQGPKFKKFLRHMYGDQPNFWHNKLQGMDRLRVITNYLTRIRFCDDIGAMNLLLKEGPAIAPRNLKPWFTFERISPRVNILFGHWAALEGETGKKNVYALDTGFVWGRTLTMMRLEDNKLFTV